MDIFAKIEDGVVKNLVVFSGPPNIDGEFVFLGQNYLGVKIGFEYDGNNVFYGAKGEVIDISNIESVEESLLIKNKKIIRNKMLEESDWIVPITDHPKHDEYIKYRQLLRDFTELEGFPYVDYPVKP